jgi:hypothetical protein
MISFLLFLALAQSTGDAIVDEALRHLQKDPPIARVQEAALMHFKVGSADLSGYRMAARLRALMPAVTGSYSRDDNKITRLSTDALDFGAFDPENPQVTDETSGVGRAFAASATWNLSTLVFDPSELEVYALTGIHEDVVQEVTRLYYTRQHNLLSMALDPPADRRAKAGLVLRIREAEAMLDAMTGGAWTRMVGEGR